MTWFEFMSWRITCMRVLSVAAGALATVVSLAAPSYAGIVNFGSGGNTFSMEFKTIGNPNNTADTTGLPNPAGAVGYTYDIGKFEVSRAMVTAYNANPGVVQITLDSMPLVNGGPRAAMPAAGISWNEAARFVNWLNTQKGFAPAYKFTTNGSNDNIALWDSTANPLDFDASNRYRSKRANFFLPSLNEWYKAAYYDPNKSGGAGYWDYATGSDSAPAQTSGSQVQGEAVYNRTEFQGPADVTNAGGLSPYGVMGLNGNVWEWEETSLDLANSNGSSTRGLRGGGYASVAPVLLASARGSDVPSAGNSSSPDYGFRVSSYNSDAVVPEPSMMVIGMVFGLGGLAAKRRLKK
ncbi:MAG: formylglycine-generating enzyme family protein [Pirellula sp.]